MPALSGAQRRWAFGVKGEAWARKHHFDNQGHLPEYIKDNAKSRANRRKRDKKHKG